jgi:hypothetical protein
VLIGTFDNFPTSGKTGQKWGTQFSYGSQFNY